MTCPDRLSKRRRASAAKGLADPQVDQRPWLIAAVIDRGDAAGAAETPIASDRLAKADRKSVV